jgi:NAD(P)-dependent dehydrogenase (short-subunit alcohol dehydrogenase family)
MDLLDKMTLEGMQAYLSRHRSGVQFIGIALGVGLLLKAALGAGTGSEGAGRSPRDGRAKKGKRGSSSRRRADRRRRRHRRSESESSGSDSSSAESDDDGSEDDGSEGGRPRRREARHRQQTPPPRPLAPRAADAQSLVGGEDPLTLFDPSARSHAGFDTRSVTSTVVPDDPAVAEGGAGGGAGAANALEGTGAATSAAAVTGGGFSDVCALVTGASSGIGRAVAIEFAREGCRRLALHYHSNLAGAQATRAQCLQSGARDVRLYYAELDDSTGGQARGLMEEVTTDFPGLNVLVNNAGKYAEHASDAVDATFEAFRNTLGEALSVNLVAPALLTWLFCRHVQGLPLCADPDAADRSASTAASPVQAASRSPATAPAAAAPASASTAATAGPSSGSTAGAGSGGISALGENLLLSLARRVSSAAVDLHLRRDEVLASVRTAQRKIGSSASSLVAGTSGGHDEEADGAEGAAVAGGEVERRRRREEGIRSGSGIAPGTAPASIISPTPIPAARAAVVMIGSRGAFRGEPFAWGYGASKAALHSLGQNVALSFGKHGITCVSVAPGFVRTPMADALLDSPAGLAVTSQSPFQRVATVEEVAECVVFASSFWKNAWITGGIIDCNGASYLRS